MMFKMSMVVKKSEILTILQEIVQTIKLIKRNLHIRQTTKSYLTFLSQFQMLIDESGLSDKTITSPHRLFGQINAYSQTLGTIQILNRKKLIDKRKSKSEIKVNDQKQKCQAESQVKKKKDGVGLKRLIRQQKIENIKRKFIAKLKLNNVNSTPVQFQPYYKTQSSLVFDRNGIQIPDYLQKLISGLIVLTILLCVFVDTTYIAFPLIVKNKVITVFQLCSLCVFLFQFFSSMVVVKMVDGKKIYPIRLIFKNYFEEGMFMDFAYLVVLIIDIIGDSGWFRLIILLKLPQCFERIQKIENSLINTFYKQQYWGLAKVFLLNFALSHFLGIILILMSNVDKQHSWMAKLNIDNSSESEQYVWSFYWGTTIMLTVGFGDIAPANFKEAICIVLIETFSCLALAYNINCVGNLISNIKSQDIQKNKNIKTFKILSNRNNLTENLQMKIHNYIQESTNIKKKFNFEEQSNFIMTLPRQLKGQFLKQSNKRIFQSLVFFKNLTQKTLLNFAQVIQMKICHPEEIIKKRGQIAGIMVLKQGKIGLTTKMNGSDFNNVTIETLTIDQSQEPFLLSLDFLSNDRSIYEVKSEQYSILYYLDRQKTLQVLKTGQLDYEHFCFLRDKCRNLQTDFQVFRCNECKLNHSKFDCPKIHYCPLKKHVIDKYLHSLKISKAQRRPLIRSKTIYNPFVQLQNNLKLFQVKQQTLSKYASYKSNKIYEKSRYRNSPLDGKRMNQPQKTLTWIRSQKCLSNSNGNANNMNLETYPSSHAYSIKDIADLIKSQNMDRQLETQKRIEYQYMATYLKDQLQKIISNQNQVWLIQTDQVKNFKFYFISYNAGTLQYLNRNKNAKSTLN